MTPEKQEILNKLRNWALKNDDVNCILCCGSHGNQVSKISDDFSDLDLVMFTKRLKFYLHDNNWIPDVMGPIAHEYTDMTSIPGIPGIRKVFFENGVRMDILFWTNGMLNTSYRYFKLKKNTPLVKLFPSIVRKIIESRYSYFPKYISRGFEAIVDKRNFAQKASFVELHNRFRQEPVTSKKLQFTVERFWVMSLQTAISIHRGELFVAKTVGDRTMKQLLLHLIEMYTKLSKSLEYDMWQDGRHMEWWGAPFITRRLKTIYGSYETEDAWRAMMETIDLFSLILSRLTTEFPEIKVVNPEKHFRKLIKAVEAGTTKAMSPEYSAG